MSNKYILTMSVAPESDPLDKNEVILTITDKEVRYDYADFDARLIQPMEVILHGSLKQIRVKAAGIILP